VADLTQPPDILPETGDAAGLSEEAGGELNLTMEVTEDELEVLEAGMIAWAGTSDLFSELEGLESSEEELLRELIAEAEAETSVWPSGAETGTGDGVLQ
jgi:hypothetical protein